MPAQDHGISVNRPGTVHRAVPRWPDSLTRQGLNRYIEPPDRPFKALTLNRSSDVIFSVRGGFTPAPACFMSRPGTSWADPTNGGSRWPQALHQVRMIPGGGRPAVPFSRGRSLARRGSPWAREPSPRSRRPPPVLASPRAAWAAASLASGGPFPGRPRDFVTVRGGKFSVDGKPLRFGGTNTYYLHQQSHYMIDSALNDAAAMSLTVVRAWAFADGSGNSYTPLQSAPYVYNIRGVRLAGLRHLQGRAAGHPARARAGQQLA